jgi:transposase-like protein
MLSLLQREIKNGNMAKDDDFTGLKNTDRIEDPILDKSVMDMTNEEINEFISNPVRRSKVTTATKRVKCKICGIEYSYNSGTSHRRTKLHQAYQAMNDRIRDLLLQT